MLTTEQIESIVVKINAKINLPILGEKAEAFVFKMAVKQILKFLENNLPEEWMQLINDATDGLTPQEVDNIVEKLVRYMNAKIDIPLLGEDVEATLFDMVVRLIIEAMTKNKNLESLLAAEKI